MSTSITEAAMEIRGVRGATELRAPNQLSNSKLGSKVLDKLFAELMGEASKLEGKTGFGSLRTLAVLTRQNEHLALYLKGGSGLGVACEASRPLAALSKEIRQVVDKG